MAELCARTPSETVTAIRRRAAARQAVEDLAAALERVPPLPRLQAREALEELVRVINGSRDTPEFRNPADDLAAILIRAHHHALEADCLDAYARVFHAAWAATSASWAAASADYEVAIAAARDAFAAAGADHDHTALYMSASHGASVVCRAGSLLSGQRGGPLLAVLSRVFESLDAVMGDHEAHTRLDNVLQHARDHFLHADLSQADLAEAWLEGVVWTPATTCWPVAWRDRIEQESIEIFPGVWQIRSGNLREEVPV
jgi:hypothetical protein